MTCSTSNAPLTADQSEQIHQAALQILADPGLKIMEDRLLDALDKAGANVDKDTQQVRFPAKLVEETLAGIQADLKSGVTMPVLNGVISSKTDGKLRAKFGGACCSYYDWAAKASREPTNTDVVTMLKLGQAIDDVAHVGNPVIYMRTDDGQQIPPHLKPIKTAAFVANHTSRPYSCEVWSLEGLEFQIEIGCVVRGGWEAYKADPIFITAKETISPLQLPREDAEVLMALAKKGLPCTIIPMPLSGTSSPVTPIANVAMGTAEILGVFTALRAYEPAARVAGGVITGVMDMASGDALFANPNAILQDRLIATHFGERYGLDLGIGTGYIDAPVPGIQTAVEKTFKIMASHSLGRTNYPVGIIEGGKTFCPAQAMLDLEIARAIHKAFGPAEVTDETLAIDVMRRAGIAGSVLADDHTADHFRDVLHFSDLFAPSAGSVEAMLDKADAAWKDIVANTTPFELPGDKAEQIDSIVAKAEKFFEENTP
ncbi:MAG: trimethylamine methyltransferase family protein [Planctomycetota bacterium]|jgi:trimethylamine--corrinoid protein Co-methyltransferase